MPHPVNTPHAPSSEQARCNCDAADLYGVPGHRDYCEALHPYHFCDPRTCRFSEAETCPHDVPVTDECDACEGLPTWQQLGIDPVVRRLTDLLSEPDDIHVIDTADGLALHRVAVAKLAHRIAGDRELTACYGERFESGDAA